MTAASCASFHTPSSRDSVIYWACAEKNNNTVIQKKKKLMFGLFCSCKYELMASIGDEEWLENRDQDRFLCLCLVQSRKKGEMGGGGG